MDSVDHLIALLTPIEVPATLGRYNRFSTDQTKVHGNLVGAQSRATMIPDGLNGAFWFPHRHTNGRGLNPHEIPLVLYSDLPASAPAHEPRI